MATPVTDPINYAPVTRRYRQWLAGGVALALHALVIGAVAGRQWTPEVTDTPPPSVTVILTRQPAVEPQAARAIAEASQAASGPESTGRDTDGRREQHQAPAEPAAPSTPGAPPEPAPAAEPAASSESPEPAEPAEPPAAPQPEAPAPPEPAPRAQPAPKPATPPVPAAPAEPPRAEREAPAPSGQSLLAQASSSVRERGFEAAPAGGGESDVSQRGARQAAEARYIEDWTRRVETYGNRFYPAPPELDGQLRIRVVIGRDGQLREAEVIQSSGEPELDQAALDTVRGAAPYRPFDSGMGSRDSLTLTRVWRYGKGNNFGVR